MSKTVALDAGHGMYTPGKRCMKALDPNETREWWLNDRVADRLEKLLSDYECKVVRLDDITGAKDISLAGRVKTAVTAKAEIYLAIHHNAGINGKTGGGTVVFYCSSDAKRLQKAKRLYESVVESTGLKGNRKTPVAYRELYVLKRSPMPAYYIENGFMDSQVDTPIILTEEHAQKTAGGILNFLISELKLKKKEVPKEETGEKEGTGNSIYYPAYKGKNTILVSALTSLGINSAYSHRKKIASANNIKGYTGTAAQNTQMYNLLKAGLLKRSS